MKKMLCAAVVATAFISAPAFAKSQGLGIGASVLSGKGGVLGLLDGRAGFAVNAAVTTGKGGVLGIVTGKGSVLSSVLGKGGVGGLLGGGCGCGH